MKRRKRRKNPVSGAGWWVLVVLGGLTALGIVLGGMGGGPQFGPGPDGD